MVAALPLAALPLLLCEAAAALVYAPLDEVRVGAWLKSDDAKGIDRKAVVTRHNAKITCATVKNCSLLDFQTLGNGDFAFTVDATGLQTFNRSIPVLNPGPGDQKSLSCPVNTMANWGWHSTPVSKSLTPTANVSLWKDQELTTYGHTAVYPTGCAGAYQNDAGTCPTAQRQVANSNYLRANPHRLNLGRLFLASPTADVNSITDVSQSLNMWDGRLSSNFTLAETAVQVTTVVGTKDVVAVQLRSELLSHGLHLGLAFPYGSELFSGPGADWARPDDHTSKLRCQPAPGGGVHGVIERRLDNDTYIVLVSVEGPGSSVTEGRQPHLFEIRPPTGTSILTVTVSFSSAAAAVVAGPVAVQTFGDTARQSAESYQSFWTSGALIDFSQSTDSRAALLEKQVIMSLYVGRSQEAGSLPPQETGLVSNSWFGKFHGEMRMWHQSMLVAFGRPELFARSTEYYLRLLDEAKAYASSQGYKGARWFKMRAEQTNTVFTGPSAVGPLLLQEQPHPVVYAELLYRAANTSQGRSAALKHYGELVQATADFMASFALMSSGHDTRGCLNLGPPMLPGMGVETNDPGNEASPMTTENGVYELVYFRYTLGLAQEWRKRRGLPPDADAAKVLETLCLPQKRPWKNESVYFFTDGSTELIGNATALGQLYACAHIPCLKHGIDLQTMQATLRLSSAEFDWNNAYPGDDRACERVLIFSFSIDFIRFFGEVKVTR